MIGIALMLIGGVLAIIGSLGLIRFPDVYTRSHAQTVVNVGGVCLILVGVLVDQFFSIFFIKALFLIILIFVTAPVATHAITKAAYISGVKPKVIEDEWKKLKR
ncbi:MAG: hypothetical protein GTN76_05315 [Candidatus Aenigmarchaeota archaeon]|nr:hypothetical protein [Candidatus Aenigmarchaeota archaeon]